MPKIPTIPTIADSLLRENKLLMMRVLLFIRTGMKSPYFTLFNVKSGFTRHWICQIYKISKLKGKTHHFRIWIFDIRGLVPFSVGIFLIFTLKPNLVMSWTKLWRFLLIWCACQYFCTCDFCPLSSSKHAMQIYSSLYILRYHFQCKTFIFLVENQNDLLKLGFPL